MDQLREGIGLRAYGQKNPLIEYKQEGFGMFAEMMAETNQETLRRIFRTNIQQAEQKPSAPRPIPANLKMQHDETAGMGFVPPPQGAQQSSQPQAVKGPSQARQPITAEKKVGRNNPCTCGSGKKYKKCCGMAE
jgi:preprotein translocase subunit SecA